MDIVLLNLTFEPYHLTFDCACTILLTITAVHGIVRFTKYHDYCFQ